MSVNEDSEDEDPGSRRRDERLRPDARPCSHSTGLAAPEAEVLVPGSEPRGAGP